MKVHCHKYHVLFAFFLFLFPGALLVASPLRVSPQHINAEVNRGENAASRHFDIFYSGQGEISYSVTSGASWLQVQPAQGRLHSNQRNRHQVNFNTRHLRAGQYTGRIEIRSQSISAPVRVEVSLHVRDLPDIQVHPRSINKTILPGEKIHDLTISISCSSRHPVEYHMTSNVHWLQVSPSFGTVSSRRPQSHRLSISTRHLRRGNNRGRITLMASDTSNMQIEIPVNITVDDVPPVEISPHFIFHRIQTGQFLPNERLTIRNTGWNTADFRISTNAYWIKVYPSQGRVGAQRVQHLDIVYDVSRLMPGIYRARIWVESSGLPDSYREIPVELIIEPAALVRVQPEELRLIVPHYQKDGFVHFAIQNYSHSTMKFIINSSSPFNMITSPMGGWVDPQHELMVKASFDFTFMPYGNSYGFFEIVFPEYSHYSLRIPVTVYREFP